jgi:ATP-dependent Clp protease ATP-binding subunit ClpA
VFERFTERARQVVVYAQDEARALKHNYIGTEHLLLGLLREKEGPAARVLEGLDVTVEEVRAQVARIVGEGEQAASGQIPFTPNAKKVLELSLREALSLGHNYIGTEHVLLGLVRLNKGVAARILLDFDADAEKVRNRVVRELGLPSRPVDPELRAEMERVRAEKEVAFARGDEEQAAALEARERRLRRVAEPVPLPPGRIRARDVAIPFAFGWLLFGVALGVGVLVGWAIWGL